MSVWIYINEPGQPQCIIEMFAVIETVGQICMFWSILWPSSSRSEVVSFIAATTALYKLRGTHFHDDWSWTELPNAVIKEVKKKNPDLSHICNWMSCFLSTEIPRILLETDKPPLLLSAWDSSTNEAQAQSAGTLWMWLSREQRKMDLGWCDFYLNTHLIIALKYGF